MREIQIFQTNNNLPAVPTANDIAKVRLDTVHYPRYSTVPQNARVFWMSGAILRTAKLRNAEITAKEATIYAGVLDGMMINDQYMADLTQPEIEDAFKNGIFGLYGEYYGFSAVCLYQFLDGYINSDKKLEAAEIVRKTKAEIRAEKTKAEYEAEQRRIREEIEEAKRNGTFVPTGKAWFKPKSVDEAIAESEAHREKVMRQAQEILSQNNKPR